METKEIKEIKKYDPEEYKKNALSVITFPDTKDSLLKELVQDIIPKYIDTESKEKEDVQKRFTEKSILLLRIFENESHVGLMESFTDKYQMTVREMSKTMISEFNCSNEAEKALVGLIVNAYMRVLDNSRRLDNELEGRNITHERNVYIANLSKQIDRANRQFISALLTLKQLKAPTIEMNIKANTAFVSNHQQINVNKPNENNEVK